MVGVESHIFRNGGITFITLLSNPLQRVDELGPPDFKSNKRFETPVPVKITLPVAAHVYNARTGKVLGQKKMLEVTVTPYEPVILVSSPAPLPPLSVSAVADRQRARASLWALPLRALRQKPMWSISMCWIRKVYGCSNTRAIFLR